MNNALVLQLIESYGLIAVFVLIALEYACLPVPSEVVLPFAGAYAAWAGTPFLIILSVSVAAGLIGSAACYLIGYYGGGAVSRRMERNPKSKFAKGIAASQQWFDRHGNVSVMAGRVLPLCRTYISFVAGFSRQKFLRFMLYSAAGIALWNLVLVGLGYRLAARWEDIAVLAQKYSYILLPFVLLLLYFVVRSIRKSAVRRAEEPQRGRDGLNGK